MTADQRALRRALIAQGIPPSQATEIASRA